MTTFEISKTIAVVSNCFELAESDIREDVSRFQPRATEEEITSEFQLALSKRLHSASKNDEIAKAFATDLTAACPRAIASKSRQHRWEQ